MVAKNKVQSMMLDQKKKNRSNFTVKFSKTANGATTRAKSKFILQILKLRDNLLLTHQKRIYSSFKRCLPRALISKISIKI